MNIIMLANGNLLVPARVEAEGIVGDGAIEITVTHPDYEKWLPFITEHKGTAAT